MIDRPVVTRFAPSPTGSLHVGGARTALFAWAYARQQQGRFLLRIEDTDQKRSSEVSRDSILRDLRWLGLGWDDEPVCQSDRLPIYQEQIDRLVRAGVACEQDGAVRFRCDQDVNFEDAVFGPIEVKAADIEDFVIRKSDGFPTFHLAVVVDDALMGITHVIRGQEHLSNTPKHVALQRALGFDRPVYVHLPTIMNPDGSKMSKRDKAKVARAAAKAQGMTPDAALTGIAGDDLAAFLDKKNDEVRIASAIAGRLGVALPEIEVADFRRSGYLPAVLLNYLALLGWNPGNDVEKFDLRFLVEHFSFERIGKTNSRFDRAKLMAFNADALRGMTAEHFERELRTVLESDEMGRAALAKLGSSLHLFAAAYRERSRTLREPLELGRFLLVADDGFEYDAKAVQKVLAKNDGAGWKVLAQLESVLEECDPWDAATIHQALEEHGSATGLKLGDIAQPLRVAVSGSTVSPAIHDTLAILGKAATIARMRRCLALSAV